MLVPVMETAEMCFVRKDTCTSELVKCNIRGSKSLFERSQKVEKMRSHQEPISLGTFRKIYNCFLWPQKFAERKMVWFCNN